MFILGNHTDVVKLLILHGGNLDVQNKSGLRPIDVAGYHADSWRVLREADQGVSPVIEEVSDVPHIPEFAIAAGSAKKKKKKKGSKKAGNKKGKKKKK